MNWYFDSSVLVAAAVRAHSHHARAAGILDELVKKKHRGYVSAHGLVEVYSVLTRAPFTPPVYPSEAWQILEQSFVPNLEVVTLSGKEYRDVIRDCAARGVAGGLVYDALHLRCAEKAGCERVYTFNVKEFRRLAPQLEDRICAP